LEHGVIRKPALLTPRSPPHAPYYKRRVSVSTRYFLFDRQVCTANTLTRQVGDDRIELPSPRCKRDAIPFHQSPAAVQGFEPRPARSERAVRPAHSTATAQTVGDRGVEPRLAASKAAVQGRYTNPQCAMQESNSHRRIGGQRLLLMTSRCTR
jgi:hypothetical protein